MSSPSNTSSHRPRWRIARRIVQCATFLLFLLPLLASGWALFGLFEGGDERVLAPADMIYYGTLSSSSIGEVTILDPYGALQLAAASRSFPWEWILFSIPVLVFYALIRGRSFCGWVCPFNFFLEGVDFLRKKLHLTPSERVLPRRTKIGVALGVLVLSFVIGVPFFETFSPISTLNKGIVLGSTAGILTLVVVVIMELFWGHRVWCRSICPLGGFYQAIGRVGLVKVKIDHHACIHCDACKEACLTDPEILDPAIEDKTDYVFAGDCMVCGKCIDSCPTQALSMKITPKVK